jgi:hypothetical protein
LVTAIFFFVSATTLLSSNTKVDEERAEEVSRLTVQLLHLHYFFDTDYIFKAQY